MLSEKMTKQWNKFTDKEKQSIEARYDTLRTEYMTLQEIRNSRNITQSSLAELLGIKQENVSRMEHRKDMHISTMRDYVEALGGTIEINAIFPNKKSINILNCTEENKS